MKRQEGRKGVRYEVGNEFRASRNLLNLISGALNYSFSHKRKSSLCNVPMFKFLDIHILLTNRFYFIVNYATLIYLYLLTVISR